MAKRFPFDLPARTVLSWAGPEGYDSYASFQEDIWNEAGPGAWWDWWLETHPTNEVRPALNAVEQLVTLGCDRVELLAQLRNLAAAGVSYGITAPALRAHLHVVEKLVEEVTSIQGTGLMLDPAVAAAAGQMMEGTRGWLEALRPHEPKLHRTRFALRDTAIRRFGRWVFDQTGRTRHTIIAPLVSVCIGTHFTEAQLRMLRDRTVKRRSR